MKKIFTLCVVLCLSYLTMGASTPKHEFRATWLTTAWGNDWPKTKATSDATRKQQQDSLIAIFDRLQAGNMNAVCLQVRGRSDAFYQSSYEPWAAELAGARGKDPGYDPLAFAIEEAHKRGLELHAWVNPFRVTSAGTLDANDLVKKNAGQWIIQYNNGSFTGEIIDPGYPEAREYVLNVLMEIISNYDIDGIVMDDYFYPYGGTTTEDAASKALHKPANVVDVNKDGKTDDDWRRSNVDVFLKEFYNRIQTTKPWVRLGMGTFGIWTTQSKVAQAYGISLPSGISGLDDYDEQACNPVEWVQNGYVDYINPQLYWPTTSTSQNYNKLCQWWAKDVCEHFSNQLTNGKKVHFFSSQSISSNSAVSEIQAEIDANRSNLSSGYTGSVFFDTDAYLTMDKDLMTSRFATNALTPPMDWKSNTALVAPTNLTVSGSTLTWQHATAERFTVYVYPKGTAWSTAKNDPAYLQGVIYGKSMDISGIDTNANDIAVCAYDRYGVEHTAAVYSNDSGAGTTPNPETIIWELNGGEVNTVTVEVPSLTTLEAQFKNDYNSYFGASVATTREITNFLYYGSKEEGGSNLVYNMMNDPASDWTWLRDYIISKSASNTTIQTALLAGTDAHWRYSIVAFLTASAGTNSTYTVDFSIAGQPSKWGTAYQIAHGAVLLPTYVTSAYTLPTPVHPSGYEFLGWYDNAEFAGSPLTTIPANWTGTLYAQWQENAPTIDPTWQITYTSSNDSIVTPYATDVFGANIVSNTYENGVGTITFDGPVTSIGDYAFHHSRSLTSITIPNSVTSIGVDAFYDCSLISITIPNSVTSIGNSAFHGCSSLTSITIPNSVTSIGNNAFANCSSLTSITIPNSVTTIGRGAFSYCSGLISIVVDVENTTYDSRENCNAIIETATNTLIAGCQNTIISNSVTSIGDRAFFGCSSLTSITIPNSVTSIRERAFQGCSSLTSITIPNSVISIGDNPFGYTDSLTNIVVETGNIYYDSRENCNAIILTSTNTLISGCQNTIIPSGVTTIGYIAFLGCSSLISITIPNSVTSIGGAAFSSCSGLTSITIPSNVESVGDFAFGWDTLDTLHIEATTPPTLGSHKSNSSLLCYIPCGTLAAYETSDWAQYVSEFIEEGCPKITYELNGGVTNEYGWMSKDDMYHELLVDINAIIPTSRVDVDTVTLAYDKTKNISEGIPTYWLDESLNVLLTNSDFLSKWGWLIDYIEGACASESKWLPSTSARYLRFNLSAFFFEKEYTSWPQTPDYSKYGLYYNFQTAWKHAYTNPTNPTEEFTLNTPYKEGYTFAGWYTNADLSGEKITIVEAETNDTLYAKWIENSLVESTWKVLYTSTNGGIVAPNAIDVFGANIVSNTYENGVGTITFDGPVTSIGTAAFHDCLTLKSITIPNSVNSIGVQAFSDCSAIDSLTIPENVNSISGWAFMDCSSLLSIVVAQENMTYDSRENCNAIIETATNTLIAGCQNTIVPNSVTSIGEQAFRGHSSLTSITIPNSVTSIGNGAFYYCSSLDTIYVEATTPPTLVGGVFKATPSPTCIIPCGTLAAYEASDWASQVSEFVEEGCAPIQMCGDDLYWEYADGLLTITGTGEMYDYAKDTDVPWYDVRGNIKTVSLPDAMTKIGQNAFYKCTAMTTINMPTSLTAIGEKAFAQDTKLACEIILPASMTTIATRAFFNCQAVTAFHIEATTPPTIPNDAFERTTAPIHVPCGYGHIYGKHAQWGMLNLEMCEVLQDNVYYYPIDGHTARAVTYHSNPTDTIVIPSAVVIDGMPRTVIEVADFAFTDCANLPAISFNEGLEYIGERAFVRCYGLQGTIVLPATLETIGERAFSYCDNVEKYLIQAMTPPALGDGAFTCANHDALFYVSCEVMDDYKVATNWSSLKSRLRDACLNIYHYNTALGANGVHTTEDTLVASIYYRRKFTPYRWETLYLPFEVDRVTVLEDGLEYDLTAWDIVYGGHYFLAKPDGMLNKEILFGFTDELESHTPYIIQFSDAYYTDKLITFYGKESWNKLSTSFEVLSSSAWMQIAGNTTLQDQTLEEPVYMLRGTSNFILQNTTTTLHPFECYVMPYATPSGTPARMNVRLRDDVATAVESVKGNESRLAYTINDHTLTVYPQGQAFSIYSLNGALIYSCEAGKEAVDCELNSGCYLLHAGTEAHKIML